MVDPIFIRSEALEYRHKTKSDLVTSARTSMPNQYVTLTIQESVATLLLDRPQALNALNRALRTELHQTLLRLADTTAVRAVVLGGTGRAFCAGADLKESGDGCVERELLDEYRPCFDAIAGMNKPVIAAVAGSAAGVGLSLALHCDLLIMADDAVLIPAFGRIGLVPDGGASYLLVRQLGYRRAFEIFIEAEPVHAARALDLGLANKLVGSAQLLDEARNWATRLADRSPEAVGGTKKLLRLAMNCDFDEVFAQEAKLQEKCARSDYFQQRLREFRQQLSGARATPNDTKDGTSR